MWLRVSLAFVVLIAMAACGQHKSQSAASATPAPSLEAASFPSLEVQAHEVKSAFLRKDFNKYADLTYPRSVQAAGGKEKFIKELEQDLEKAEGTGLRYLSFAPGPPSQIVRDSETLYAVLPNHMVVKDSEGTFRVYGCMIGVSTDNGHNWTFLDVGAEGKPGLSLFIGNVADKLDLPPDKKPEKLSP
jgi:hypothetical protein